MTQFTASEVRDLAKRGTDAMQQFIDGRHTLHIPPQHDDADMVIAECLRAMDAFADLLEAQEKAVPIGWVFQHEETGRMTFCENDGVNNAENFAANNPRHVLCGPAFTHPAPSDAERLAEALRKIAREPRKPWPDPFGHSLHAFASAVHATWCDINRMACAALAAHPAQAQPPAASVPDGFVFERVNMGRGNERYVGLADGSEGTTVQEDGDGPGDTRSRLLWRIADAALGAQENPNG